MSKKSNDQGRAYEYACIQSLREEISKIRPCVIIENSSLETAKRAWETLSDDDKNIYHLSSRAAVTQIFILEPRITEGEKDPIELLIQTDANGESGDVRDILIIRQAITWEIGLSLKHNYFAVKHSRLSSVLDFAKSWFGYPCTKEYWESIKPIFNYLAAEKAQNKKFSDLQNKEDDVYIPILNAFLQEIKRQYELHPDVPCKMVEYLLGKYDFYKIISIDREEMTKIESFNLHGTLNKSFNGKKSVIRVPVVSLPKRIVHMEFAPDSKTTVYIYMDGGWQFSFRIHNAATKVETSLKFDIQIVGMPTAILTINCLWK